jgi:pimeloyl-ACP methyl ester carboxylesterase
VVLRREVQLPSGRLRYAESGSGPAVVFVHGLFVDAGLWRDVVEAMGDDFRCIRPDLPLGAHAVASGSSDMSPAGVANLLAEFLEALDLQEVTLVANDTGGAIAQLLLAKGCQRVGRVVFTPCDSFENFLPRSIRVLQYAARVPGLLAVGSQAFRWGWSRRVAFHWLAVTPVRDELTAEWTRPLIGDRRIRREVVRFLAAIDHRDTVAAAERLRDFTRPVLLLWPPKAPYFPFAHAERWLTVFPDARLVAVPDAYTFVSLDQPEVVAREISAFIPRDQAQADEPITAEGS